MDSTFISLMGLKNVNRSFLLSIPEMNLILKKIEKDEKLCWKENSSHYKVLQTCISTEYRHLMSVLFLYSHEADFIYKLLDELK